MNIKVEFEPKEEDLQFILDALNKFNENNLGHIEIKRLGVFLKDDNGNIVGGVQPICFAKWVYITHLWISEQHRGKGFGKRLLLEAETKAKELGCEFAMLDTFSFQAPEFYEKYGYQMISKIDNNPIDGVTKYYYKKNI